MWRPPSARKPSRTVPRRSRSRGADASAAGEAVLFDRGEPARRALLMAGSEIFGEKGLEVATTREIAARAGQNIASIAYYFESKEGLYLAIAHEIAKELLLRIGPLLERIEAERSLEPDAAYALLRQLVTVIIAAMLRTEQQAALTQFIVREQQRPTAAFDVLYAGGMGRVHRSLTRLFACVLGLPPAHPLTVVRAHALFGQMMAFRAGRALILRSTGWREFGEAEIRLVQKGVLENLDALCGRATQRRPRRFGVQRTNSTRARPAPRRPEPK
jgi:AcrR family transcriptional regulator